ncbi:hypothetical protein [Enterobacter asburiae]|uniref:hypothetical protein n=1 Tax=Enterobacter asburiae TaxID=61645 RepID=UPI00210BC9EE|nr:hypothetical protein [Enterobacter asburiae]MCQ4369184.1 hypothetical protein [Enterobacter asburiae]HDC4619759.1 hypothetical protein [Enterobacter asburiae]
MKKIIFMSYLLCTPVDAALLRCEQYKADRMSGTIYLPDGAATNLHSGLAYTGTALGSPKYKNFHVTINFPNSQTNAALAGNYVRIRHSLPSGNAYSYSSTPIPLGVNTFTVTIPCNENVSNQCDVKNTKTDIVLTSNYSSSLPARVNKNITMPNRNNPIESTVLITSNNIQISDMTFTQNHQSIIAENVTMDSITFPDNIDLGTLFAGQINNYAESIDYEVNTNSIPISIETRSATESTSLKVNNEIVDSNKQFTPPLTLGLDLTDFAQPGNKSAIVGVSWTCP